LFYVVILFASFFHERPDADADDGEIIEEKNLDEGDEPAPFAFATLMRESASLEMAPVNF
jgi:hypothetical protein